MRAPTIPLDPVLREIDRWRDRVIDTDLAVDDARADLGRAVRALQDAIRERDRAVAHLCHLMKLKAA